MADRNQWAFDIKTLIPTLIKARTQTQLQKKYPKIRYTSEQELDGNPVFPTVYIALESQQERGRNFEGNEINAVYATFQLKVQTNTSRADCDNVTNTILLFIKSMKEDFEISNTLQTKANKIYVSTTRFAGTIAANDRLM